MKKVYFAGSIRGGRAEADLYRRMIGHIQEKGTVLTEHVGDPSLSLLEQGRDKDAAIYARDTAWLRECDLVIAECTTPSLGVGFELAYAEAHRKPAHIFYDRTKIQLSAMLTGDGYFCIHPYEDPEEIFPLIDVIMSS